jgi:hypothetical protein
MNRRQVERVEDLGRAFQEAIGDIINMGEEVLVEIEDDSEMAMTEPDFRPRLPFPEPQPSHAVEHSVSDYEVSIRQVNNGFVVTVGCQTFVFEKFETASKYMAMYFENPSETIRKHYEGTLFK